MHRLICNFPHNARS